MVQTKTHVVIALAILNGDKTNVEQAMQDRAIQRTLVVYTMALRLYNAAYWPLVPLGLLALLTWQTFLQTVFLWALLAASGTCLFCMALGVRLQKRLNRLLAPYHLSLHIQADAR